MIAQKNPDISPRHLGVFMYDNGVQRPQSTPGHTGSNSITFGETASVMYGYTNESTEFGFRTMAVAPGGITVTSVTMGLIESFVVRIRYASGRVYVTTGAVIDAERRARVGTLGGSGEALFPDPALGRVYVVSGGTISAFDLNTFQLLGSVGFTRAFEEHPALSRMRLVRWGTDGLAFRDGQKVYIFRTTLAAP